MGSLLKQFMAGVGGGRSWSSYWATRTPGSLVLTVLSDTSIRLNWEANGVGDYDGYSVERSADGVTYSEIDTVAVGTETFTDTGLTADTFYWYRVRAYKGTEYSLYCPFKFAVTKMTFETNGKTPAWFDHSDLTTVTKDGSNLVAELADKLGSGHDLLQATDAKKLVWESDGILGSGDGTNNPHLQTAAFTWDQPASIYAVIKQVGWTKYDFIFSATGLAVQQTQITPEITANAGTVTAEVELPINTFGLFQLIVNGANSKIAAFLETRTGNAGTNNLEGFTLFARSSDGLLSANAKAKEIILCDTDTSTEAEIKKYLYARHYLLTIVDLYAMVGKELVLYDDSICEVKIAEEPATGTFTCAVGTDGATGFAYTPAGAGDNALSILIATASNNWRKTTTIKAYAAAGSGTKNILMIGDSLVDGTWQYAHQMRLVLDHLTLNFIGTQSGGNEGYGGWTYSSFCTRVESPFVKNGQVDIPAYFADNSIATPDFVHLRCGVNEAFGVSDVATGFTWAQLQTIGGYIDTLVNGFLSYDANLKVIIGIPTLCENTGDGWADDYAVLYPTRLQDNYIRAICQLRNYIEAKYGAKAYNVRVYVSADGYSLDRDSGYPKTEGVHTSGLHPNTAGYYQIANTIAYTINAILAGA